MLQARRAAPSVTTVETDTTAVASAHGGLAVAEAHSTSYAVKHHVFTARVYRC